MDVTLIEVGPRDGLQNEKKTIAFRDKIKFIELLSRAGFCEIEAGAFVSTKRVPQMADTEKLFEHLKGQKTRTVYSALVPNMKGMEAALRLGVKKIAVFTAASETFNQKNIHCSIDESIERFKPVVCEANKHGITVRGYVSTAFGCPYEGDIRPQAVTAVTEKLVDLGIQDISIGDTIGSATSEKVCVLLKALLARWPKEYFAMHFHDTYGRALENVAESLRFGITRYDSSAAGIGGCPFAPGARGNVSTNDLVAFLEGNGHRTGIDRERLKEASVFIRAVLGKGDA